MSLVVLLVTRGDEDRFARRVRELFERLGGLWIKAGQVIALRVDFLPAALCRELSQLQSQAMGFPGHVARAIVEDELGGPLERWFDVWEEHPVAAASIGQVYRARLREEQAWVAVKVQKPYSAELFAHDMAVIEWLVWLINRLHVYPHMKWADGLDEVPHGPRHAPELRQAKNSPQSHESQQHGARPPGGCERGEDGDQIGHRRR